MKLHPILSSHSDQEIREALELIGAGGPIPKDRVRLVRYLHTFRYANVRAVESRYEDGIHTEIISAQLTDRGRALLDKLSGAAEAHH